MELARPTVIVNNENLPFDQNYSNRDLPTELSNDQERPTSFLNVDERIQSQEPQNSSMDELETHHTFLNVGNLSRGQTLQGEQQSTLSCPQTIKGLQTLSKNLGKITCGQNLSNSPGVLRT